MTYVSRWLTLTILVSPFSIAVTAIDELSICAKKEDSLQRLVCYDKLAENSKNKTSLQKTQQQLPLQVATTERLEPLSLVEQTPQSRRVLIKSEKVTVSPTMKPKTGAGPANDISQQQATFGYGNKQSTEDLIDQIKAKVIKVKKNRFDSQTITLDNGQVWQQTSGTRLRLKIGQIVTIERGVLGSFFISKENINKRIRAKRVI
jgi:hypothetical protein